MLRAPRTTFKPQSGSCLLRGDTGLIVPESTGAGSASDAEYDTTDDFFGVDSTTDPRPDEYDIPANASILRVYLSSKGKRSLCIEVTNPCDTTDGITCDASSPCCPTCAGNKSQGLCCDTTGCDPFKPGCGVCEFRCPEDCPDAACFREDITPGSMSDEAVELQCQFCGTSACCADENGDCREGPHCFFTDDALQNPPCKNATPTYCVEDQDCVVEEGSWICKIDSTDCDAGASSCECVYSKTDGSGASTKDGCEQTTQCGSIRWQCCSGSSIPAENGCASWNPDILEQAPPCSGTPSGPFCTREQCENCCAKERFANPDEGRYAGLTIPGRAKPGQNLSADQINLFNAGPKQVGFSVAYSFTNITPEVAAAYNARREEALSASIQPSGKQRTAREATTTDSFNSLTSTRGNVNINDISVLSNPGDLYNDATDANFSGNGCQICTSPPHAGMPEDIGPFNCGGVETGMLILEYDVSDICSTTQLTFEMGTVSYTPNTTEGYTLNEFPHYTYCKLKVKDTAEPLLVDVVTTGYIEYVRGDAVGVYDCNSCNLSFDCSSVNSNFINGVYPTIDSVTHTGNWDAIIPDGQPDFPVSSGKIQNERTSTHTITSGIGVRTATIKTGVVATGQYISVYSGIDDASRVDVVKPGVASPVSLEKFPDILSNRLKWDVDRISSEDADDVYIAGNSGDALLHPYGISGIQSPCTPTQPAGVELFAVVSGSTATYTDTDSGGGEEENLLFRIFNWRYSSSITQLWEQGCSSLGCGTNSAGTAIGGNIDFGLGTDSSSNYVATDFYIIDENNTNNPAGDNKGTLADVGQAASIAIQFNEVLLTPDSGGRNAFLNEFGLSEGDADTVTVENYEFPDPDFPVYPGRKAQIKISGNWSTTAPAYAPDLNSFGGDHLWLFLNGTVQSKTVYSNDNLWEQNNNEIPPVNDLTGAYIYSSNAT